VEFTEQSLRILSSNNKSEIDYSSNNSKDLHKVVLAEALNFNIKRIGSSKVANVMQP
jgi:hypothetical protein